MEIHKNEIGGFNLDMGNNLSHSGGLNHYNSYLNSNSVIAVSLDRKCVKVFASLREVRLKYKLGIFQLNKIIKKGILFDGYYWNKLNDISKNELNNLIRG